MIGLPAWLFYENEKHTCPTIKHIYQFLVSSHSTWKQWSPFSIHMVKASKMGPFSFCSTGQQMGGVQSIIVTKLAMGRKQKQGIWWKKRNICIKLSLQPIVIEYYTARRILVKSKLYQLEVNARSSLGLAGVLVL